MNSKRGFRIAVVGATGAVGREVLTILAQRGVPPEQVLTLASARSAGQSLPFGSDSLPVCELAATALHACSLAVFAADADTARGFAPAAADTGVLVVDNSSAFRHKPSVPLVIPEVNAELLRGRFRDARLVANPNCSTIILLVALEPLRRAFGIRRVVVSTYQAVSGAGQAAIDELNAATRAALGGEPFTPRVFPEPCAFNVFSHESALDVITGRNAEEEKMIAETRRIWKTPNVPIIPTCVRVPVIRAHSQSVMVELSEPATEVSVRAALSSAPGIRLIDDRHTGRFPTPLAASGGDDVLVGRIRAANGDQDEPSREFCLFLAGDQLRKGAALNALQILDLLAPDVIPCEMPKRGSGGTDKKPAPAELATHRTEL